VYTLGYNAETQSNLLLAAILPIDYVQPEQLKGAVI
jgi:hypothetical protein